MCQCSKILDINSRNGISGCLHKPTRISRRPQYTRHAITISLATGDGTPLGAATSSSGNASSTADTQSPRSASESVYSR